MYGCVSREEWLFRGLAIATILAMVGMVVMPIAVGNCWAVGGYFLAKNSKNWSPEAALGWSICGLIISAMYGGAIGAAYGSVIPGIGTMVGFAIGF